MKKQLILGMALGASLQAGMAQSLEKMQWFNEPEQWKIENQTMALPWTTLLSITLPTEESLKSK